MRPPDYPRHSAQQPERRYYGNDTFPFADLEHPPWDPSVLIVLSIITPPIGAIVTYWNWKRFEREDHFTLNISIFVLLNVMAIGAYCAAPVLNVSTTTATIGLIFYMVVGYVAVVQLYTSLFMQRSLYRRARFDTNLLYSAPYPWRSMMLKTGIFFAVLFGVAIFLITARPGVNVYDPAEIRRATQRALPTIRPTLRPTLRPTQLPTQPVPPFAGASLATADAQGFRYQVWYDQDAYQIDRNVDAACEPLACVLVLRSINGPRRSIRVGWRPLETGETIFSALSSYTAALEARQDVTGTSDSTVFDNRQFRGGAYSVTDSDAQQLVIYAFLARDGRLSVVELAWAFSGNRPSQNLIDLAFEEMDALLSQFSMQAIS